MEYNKMISVTGLTGLFELVSSKNDGAIVKSLEDGSTRFVSSRVHQFSHLESIEIYTQRDNVNLLEIFQAMKQSAVSLPDVKDTKALRSYFEKVYPEMDFERVYTSDMKKMVKWFGTLNAKNVEFKYSHAPEETEAEVVPVVEEAVAPEAPAAPAKKATRKKKAAEE
ncbi:MAG TPA: DUF5606 domain-containing protein [Phnomibacter sp.]|nr:DUF5606 domain-containing protein [Phnomibacter sp.]